MREHLEEFIESLKKQLDIINKQMSSINYTDGIDIRAVEMNILAQRINWEIAELTMILRVNGLNNKTLLQEKK